MATGYPQHTNTFIQHTHNIQTQSYNPPTTQTIHTHTNNPPTQHTKQPRPSLVRGDRFPSIGSCLIRRHDLRDIGLTAGSQMEDAERALAWNKAVRRSSRRPNRLGEKILIVGLCLLLELTFSRAEIEPHGDLWGSGPMTNDWPLTDQEETQDTDDWPLTDQEETPDIPGVTADDHTPPFDELESPTWNLIVLAAQRPRVRVTAFVTQLMRNLLRMRIG